MTFIEVRVQYTVLDKCFRGREGGRERGKEGERKRRRAGGRERSGLTTSEFGSKPRKVYFIGRSLKEACRL